MSYTEKFHNKIGLFLQNLNKYNISSRYQSKCRSTWNGCQILRDGKVIIIFEYITKNVTTTEHASSYDINCLRQFINENMSDYVIDGIVTPPAMVKCDLYDYDHSTHESMKVFDLSKETIKLNNCFAEQGYTVSSAKNVAKNYLDKADSQKVTKLEDD